MIEDFIAQMWCSTAEEAVPKDIAAAQREAVLDSVDFKFVTGIAMEQQNIERNPSNADSIETYFKKDIDKKFGKLSPVKKAMCRLDWYAVLYRMLSYSGIRRRCCSFRHWDFRRNGRKRRTFTGRTRQSCQKVHALRLPRGCGTPRKSWSIR